MRQQPGQQRQDEDRNGCRSAAAVGDQRHQAQKQHRAGPEVKGVAETRQAAQQQQPLPGGYTRPAVLRQMDKVEHQGGDNGQQHDVVVDVADVRQGNRGQAETRGQGQPPAEGQADVTAEQVNAADGTDVGKPGSAESQQQAEKVRPLRSGRQAQPAGVW